MYTLTYGLALGPAYAATSDLRAQLVDTAGSNVGSAISTGFVNIGNGFHMWSYASMPDDHRGGVKFYSNAAASTVLAFLCVNPQEAEYTDVKTSTRGTGTSTLTTGDIDSRLAAYDAPTKAELDVTQSAIIDAVPTAAEIDTQLSGTHGAGAWSTATGFATPTNVTDAQAAILAAINALNDLSTSDIDARLAAYDGATQTDLTAAQMSITDAIASLNNLSGSDILALPVETGHSMLTVLRALYAVIRGKSVADDADDPTTVTYYAPDNSTVRVTHTLTDTTRTP